MATALILALLTDRELRGWRIYRSVLVWPFAIAAPALAMAFRFILAPEAGFLAFINQIWPGLWNPALNGVDAMICIVVAFSWKYIGYNFIFFLAGLQAIPKSRTMDKTRGRCSTTSGTSISSTQYATPSCQPIDSNHFGRIEVQPSNQPPLALAPPSERLLFGEGGYLCCGPDS